MAKPNSIELPDGACLDILYEDRSVLAIDKPPGWMLAPTEDFIRRAEQLLAKTAI